ncbi:PSD1 and planctomycete cytochrome C domain-containing protein [Rubinisphaera margarita]|uniref:PSD1 and planctomycete cytochrome C domain-containing protein n=1 Tax=Rubinisphaera margarita TaxID=2909586 RepID=UPI001EE7D5F2|nr:PSD1 and planctomycete cytochrome C domain-containing protein [Rubinisphaera margarita]MCG6156347.1 PSD1 and planctomycete cytochrome C domain-containing protein [Rubinisphaera margarita]
MQQSMLSGPIVRGFSLSTILCLNLFAQAMVYADPPVDSDAQGVEFFERRIRPLMAERCYQCHSSESKKANGGLLLDSVGGLRNGSDSGAIIVPGAPDQSLLVEVVRSDEAGVRMPPDGDRLTNTQIADIEAWLTMGAPLPETVIQEDPIATSSRTHWAFQPVKEQAVPTVRQRRWVQTPVDAFVLATLEQAGHEPAPPADKRTLIRRATYDLIGLPPTPEEVAAFEADESADAFATVVDRLLRSEHYGERWGRHWLDVARFATSDSPFAFTYRDYVIRAFNEDLPYNEFLIQQIAADQLDLGDDKRPLAALGFLTGGRQFMDNHDTIDDRIDVVTRGTMGLSVSCARCHDHKYDPIPTRDYYGLHGVFASTSVPGELPLLGIDPDPTEFAKYSMEHQARKAKLEEFIQKQQAEVLKQHRDLTAQYLLLSREPQKIAELIEGEFGLSDRKILQTGAKRWAAALETMDSKTDPIFAPWFAFAALPASEFADQAEILSAKIARNSASAPLNSFVVKAFADEPPTSLEEVASRYANLLQDADKQWQDLKDRTNPSSNSSVALPDREQEALRQLFYGKDSPGNMPADMMTRLFTTSSLMQLGPLKAQVDQLDATHPGAPLRAMVLVDRPHPQNSRIFIRGDSSRLGAEAPRQFLTILSQDDPKPFTQGSGRLELAQAIASRENPLTARVMVNRIWLHHFGRGLVTTPDDFGLRSDLPSHPELLDYLAWRFTEEGWSVKALHRLIMLSNVYQQQSDERHHSAPEDSENRLLSRMNRRRLDFEAMRDTLIAVTGKLDRTLGGRPVALMNEGPANKTSYSRRRTVYGVIDRNDLMPLYQNFDFATPDLSTSQRDITTVPQQALFFFNDPFVMQQACSLAARADFQLLENTEQRIQYVYQQLFQRDPADAEMELATRFLAAEELAAQQGTEHPASVAVSHRSLRPLRPWERLVHVLMMSNELMFVD